MKKIILMLCLMIILVNIYGCTSKEIYEDKELIKITDDNGRQVAFSKKPERIVVLSPSFLELLEVFDGNVVGRAESTIARTPAFAENAVAVGFIFNINTEKVVELRPDLIVAYKGMHEKYIQLFESNGIPVIVLNLKTYEDVKHSIKVLGELTGQKEKGIKIAAELDKKVQNTVRKLPKNTKRVAILHSSAQNVTLEQENSIAGCVAKLLQMNNIVQDIQGVAASTGEQMSDKVPYSLEFLVEKNPEIIFITSMGSKEDIEARLKNDVMSSPAWKSITAVKNNAVYYLPDELFLLNPGLRYPEAVEYMAEKLRR
ncbi:ABC transporter substrate-binding protein [uncultured Phascolarctobacterium sp.]|uniref:ABC transporter substrate-binding protein n=1 Tax=uncultured Phascolarctobacterium sp. TaxID=512296 RepID=UPI0025CFF75D|nr:ABC transporter substrate-binding protein [uncultured Phascolarctobacterium sp.]